LDVPTNVKKSLSFQSAITYRLRRAGLTIGVPERLVKEMGDQYRATGPHGFEHIVRIRDPGGRPGRIPTHPAQLRRLGHRECPGARRLSLPGQPSCTLEASASDDRV
jgi:hypothetical protein